MDKDKLQERFEKARAEYTQGCAEAGNLQYQIGIMQEDLKQLNTKLKSLNNSAHGLKKQLEKLQSSEQEQGDDNVREITKDQEALPSGVSVPPSSDHSIGDTSRENAQ